jgi:hypothetical protein
MHGGAPGSGAPSGNKNALRHGRFTREAVAERKKIRELIRETRKLMRNDQITGIFVGKSFRPRSAGG